jgi:hypothetical protein
MYILCVYVCVHVCTYQGNTFVLISLSFVCMCVYMYAYVLHVCTYQGNTFVLLCVYPVCVYVYVYAYVKAKYFRGW